MMAGLTEFNVASNSLRGPVPTELATLGAGFELFSSEYKKACTLTADLAFDTTNRFDRPVDARVLAAGCDASMSRVTASVLVISACLSFWLASLLVAFHAQLGVIARHMGRRASAPSSGLAFLGIKPADRADAELGHTAAPPLVPLVVRNLVQPCAAGDVPAAGEPNAKLVGYTANKASAPNVVITIDGAFAALDALSAGKNDANAARAVQRVGLPSSATPFVMISYVSTLKRDAVGRASIKAALEVARVAGYKYVWWDWVVIDVNEAAGRPYVQADFEVAMLWAAESAHAVFVVWPTVAIAQQYLTRPWCVSELIASAGRGVVCVLVAQDATLYVSHGSHALQQGMTIVNAKIWLMSLVFLVSFGVVQALPFDVGDAGFGMYLLVPTLYTYISFTALALVRRFLISRGLIKTHSLVFPANAVGELQRASRDDSRAQLVSALRAAGHMRGAMFDMGDAPVCAAVIGVPPAEFTFDQAMLRLSGRGGFWGVVNLRLTAEALADSFSLEVQPGRTVPHRPITGGQASWLSGSPASGSWAAVRAVSREYATELTLCTSSPAPPDATAREPSKQRVQTRDLAPAGCPLASSLVAYTARTVVLRSIVLTGDGLERAFVLLGLVLIFIGAATAGAYLSLQIVWIYDEDELRNEVPGADTAILIAGLTLEALLFWTAAGGLLSSRFTLVGATPSLRTPGLHLLLLAHLLASSAISLVASVQAFNPTRAAWRRSFHLCVFFSGTAWCLVLALAIVVQVAASCVRVLRASASIAAWAALCGERAARPHASGGPPEAFGVIRCAMRFAYPSATLLLGAISARTVS